MSVYGKLDWFIDNMLGWCVAGVLSGIVGAVGISVGNENSKDSLYVKCIYNMRERTIDQLEMMCSHLRTKP